MATSRVKGITIEIGGDTTGLDKALSGVNKEINGTKKELKDVEKLLKMDPGNTELLRQKQEALKNEVAQTSDKLQTLKNAQEEVTRQYESGEIDKGAYEAFQREIIATEQELKNLTKEMNEANVTAQKIANVGDNFQKIGTKVSSVGDNLTKNVTVPILGIGAAIVKTTADFDSQMVKVKAIAGKVADEDIQGIIDKANEMGLEFETAADSTETSFNILRAKAREMASSTKYTATEVAEGFEYMAMAGWKTEEMLDGISGVLNLAAAAGADLGMTSDIVTDALTAFGEGAQEATRYADVLAATATNANTDVEMMGETLKYAATPAATLGYSLEDVSIAAGLMANAGTKASMAGTTLRNIFQRMAKPTKESAAAMNRLGISLSDEVTGRMYSFREIMEQLRDSFGHINMPIEEFNERVAELDANVEDGTLTESKYQKEMEELIKQAYGAEKAEKARAAAMLGGSRAMSGLLGIVNASNEDFDKMTQAIDNSAGAAEEMANIMQSSTSGKLEILISKLQDLAISFGDILIPVIDQIIIYLQKFTDNLNSLDDGTKETIVKVAALVAALGPVLSIFGRLTTGIGSVLSLAPKVVSGLSMLKGAFTALWGVIVANPITAIIAAIVALVALIATKGDEIKKIIQKVDDFLQNIFAKDWTEVFGPVLGGVINNFMSMFKTQWDALKKILDGIIDFIRGVFTGDWERALNGLKNIFKGVFDSLVGLAKAPINKIITLINGLFSGINGIASKVGGSLHIPSIPMLAKGGIITSGSAIVGEAGAELLNVSNGRTTVQPLTNGGNAGHTDITDLLKTYLPYLAEGNQIILDSGALVGATAPAMNNALGQIAMRAGTR